MGVWKSLAVIVCVTGLVYLPGLAGGFIYDDFPNIVSKSALHIETLDADALAAAALSGNSGFLGRPLASLSFALNHVLGGLQPFGYKLVNLGLHIFNAILIWLLADAIVARLARGREHARLLAGVPLLVALLWAVHPINLTSVLYTVQRMTSLASMFSLAAVLAFLQCRARLNAGASALPWLLAALGFCLLGLLAKEIVVLVPVYLLALELTVLPGADDTARLRRAVTAFFVLTLLLPLLAVGAYFALSGGTLFSGYQFRDFTLAERLMTQPRVLWFYLYELLMPLPGSFSMFQNDFPVSSGLLSPLTTLPALLAGSAAVIAALLLRRRRPVFAFCVLWFAGGHLLESTALPLEMVHEHRNYLPAFGPLFGLGWLLLSGAGAVLTARSRVALAGAMVAAALVVTAFRVQEWRDPLTLLAAESARKPDYAVVQFEMGRMWYEIARRRDDPAYIERSRQYLERSAALDRQYLLPVTSLLQLALMSDGAPPEALLQDAVLRAGSAAFRPAYVGAIAALLRCMELSACRIDSQVVYALVGGAVENPTINPWHRAQVLQQLSSYYVNVLGDYDGALGIAAENAAGFPSEYLFQMSYINLLVAGGRWREARDQLDAFTAAVSGAGPARRLKLWANQARIDALSVEIDMALAAETAG